MYTEFFGLNEKPFSITPDPRYLYMTERHADALAHLLYGITESGGFIQLTGEVGTGKTTLVRSLLEQLPENVDVALILNPRISANEFLNSICDELHISVDGNRDSAKTLVDALNKHLLDKHAKNRRVVLIVDEAQNLSADVLETVRLLTNLETTKQKLLQIILVGQPELRQVLDRNDLRQLAHRVTGRYHLEPLVRDEACAYLRHRMQIAGTNREIFKASAAREIFRLSGGIPRIINVIADRTLLGAYTREQSSITPSMVRHAAAEIYNRPVTSRWLRWSAVAGLAVVAVALGFGIAQLRTPGSGETASTVDTQPAAKSTFVATTTRSARPDTAEAAVGESSAQSPAKTTVALDIPAAGATQDSPPGDAPINSIIDATVDIGAMLAEYSADTGTDSAFAQLFALWGENYSADRDRPCEYADGLGLQCEFQRGAWAHVRQINRPVILTLIDAQGNQHQVVVSGLRNDSAHIDLGENGVDVSVADIADFWFGEYLLLWRPPTRDGRVLMEGMRGDAVVWLEQSLAMTSGDPDATRNSGVFNTALRRQVMDFQRVNRLRVDGIVGVQTQIALNSALNLPNTPVLARNE